MQVCTNEYRYVVQAVLDVVDGVSGQAVHVLVIPQFSVQFHQAFLVHLAVDEEVLVLILFQVTFVDVDSKDDCTGSNY